MSEASLKDSASKVWVSINKLISDPDALHSAQQLMGHPGQGKTLGSLVKFGGDVDPSVNFSPNGTGIGNGIGHKR